MTAHDQLARELTETLCDYIRTNSVTGNEQALSDRIVDRLREAGLSPEQDADGNVLCTVGEGGKTVLLNGHLDTVPPAGTWDRDPFEPVVTGDRVWGLGSSDMKSGLSVMTALAGTVQPRARLLFTFTVNEEGGATSPRNGARAVTEKYDFDVAVTCEPTYVEDPGYLQLGVGCQGRTIATVTVHGKASHSAAFDLGLNAVYRAVPVIERVETKADALQPVPVAPGITVRPALSITIVRAGEAANVIPAECVLTVDRRLAPGEDFETFARELEELTAGVACTVEQARGSLPVLARLEGPLVKRGEELLRKKFGRLEYYYSRGRVDLSYFGRKAGEILNLGPGLIGKPHQANEYASVRAMVETYDVLKDLLESL